MKKILLIVPGGIGNMLMFTPALLTLHNKFKDYKFDLLTSGQKAEDVIKKCEFIDNIFVIKNIKKFILNLPVLRRNKYEISAASMGINPLKAGIISYLSGAKIRAGEDNFLFNRRTVSNIDTHEVDRNLKIVQQITGPDYIIKKIKIWTDDTDRSYAKQYIESLQNRGKKIIGIHAGSGSNMPEKRWPVAKFIELTKIILKNIDCKIIIFGGKYEKDIETEIISKISDDRINGLTGKTTLTQTAEIIRNIDIMITNDSGLMHIAAAVDTFVAAIFGPTILNKNRPYTDNSIIIRKDIDCSPCYRLNKKIICNNNYKCLEGISPEQVYQSIFRL